LGKDIQMMSKDKQERMFELVEQWKASGETMKDFAAYQGVAQLGRQLGFPHSSSALKLFIPPTALYPNSGN
jgi:hypothetical protein